MPPKTQPKIFQILVKTHKLTVLTTVLPSITVGALKTEVLSALTADVNQSEDVPSVSAVSEFELCKGVKDRGKPTGEYTTLDNPRLALKDAGVASWEPLFVQFRDPDSGDLLPVVFVPFEDDDDEAPRVSAPAPPPAEAGSSRGKRKARPD